MKWGLNSNEDFERGRKMKTKITPYFSSFAIRNFWRKEIGRVMALNACAICPRRGKKWKTPRFSNLSPRFFTAFHMIGNSLGSLKSLQRVIWGNLSQIEGRLFSWEQSEIIKRRLKVLGAIQTMIRQFFHFFREYREMFEIKNNRSMGPWPYRIKARISKLESLFSTKSFSQSGNTFVRQSRSYIYARFCILFHFRVNELNKLWTQKLPKNPDLRPILREATSRITETGKENKGKISGHEIEL